MRQTDIPALETAFADEKKPAAKLAQAFALVNLGKLGTAEQDTMPYLLSMLSSRTQHNVAEGYLIELARKEDVRQLLVSYLSSGREGHEDRYCTVPGC